MTVDGGGVVGVPVAGFGAVEGVLVGVVPVVDAGAEGGIAGVVAGNANHGAGDFARSAPGAAASIHRPGRGDDTGGNPDVVRVARGFRIWEQRSCDVDLDLAGRDGNAVA